MKTNRILGLTAFGLLSLNFIPNQANATDYVFDENGIRTDQNVINNYHFIQDATTGKYEPIDPYETNKGRRTSSVVSITQNDDGTTTYTIPSDRYGPKYSTTYDASGRMVSCYDGGPGTTTTFKYYSNENLKSVSSSGGYYDGSSTEFYENGKLLSTNEPYKSQTMTYNSDGSVQSMTNSKGEYQAYYTATGDIGWISSSVSNPLNKNTQEERDSMGIMMLVDTQTGYGKLYDKYGNYIIDTTSGRDGNKIETTENGYKVWCLGCGRYNDNTLYNYYEYEYYDADKTKIKKFTTKNGNGNITSYSMFDENGKLLADYNADGTVKNTYTRPDENGIYIKDGKKYASLADYLAGNYAVYDESGTYQRYSADGTLLGIFNADGSAYVEPRKIKRIYTIQEAVDALGNHGKNTFSIKYR